MSARKTSATPPSTASKTATKPAKPATGRKPRATTPKSAQATKPEPSEIAAVPVVVVERGEVGYQPFYDRLVLRAKLPRHESGEYPPVPVPATTDHLFQTGLVVRAPDGWRWAVTPYLDRGDVQNAGAFLEWVNLRNAGGNTLLIQHDSPIAVAYLVELRRFVVLEQPA